MTDDSSLAAEIDAVARLKGDFRLRSGALASEYFDKYRFEADPRLLARIAGLMAGLLPARCEVLAGLELGGVPIATAMALQTGLPAAFVRKAAKDYGTCRAVEGADVSGKAVVIVEDVITTGGQVVQSAAMLGEVGAEVIAVVCAIWRGQGAPSIEALADVPVFAAFTRADLDASRS